MLEVMDLIEVVHGERQLFERAGHLFDVDELACAANTLYTWMVANAESPKDPKRLKRMRKMFRLSAMLDPAWSRHAHVMAEHGAQVRVTPDELNETLLLGDRFAILAGDMSMGLRSYSVISAPEAVRGITALYESAWRAARPLAVHDASMVDLRPLAPGILTALNDGLTDETAARALGLSLRTYRRRVAELMTALGAASRFQAGTRARELGLV
jgi:hypothetical protein